MELLYFYPKTSPLVQISNSTLVGYAYVKKRGSFIGKLKSFDCFDSVNNYEGRETSSTKGN